jgi:glycosyltransferase involved in cell wall biosynthesis
MPADELQPLPITRREISVVIPAKNEERNLEWVLSRIPRDVGEVILVDGDSTDRTVEVARELWPSIRIVGQERRGKGAALQAGFQAATKRYIVMLDADGSMDPGEIDRFVGCLVEGNDLAKGSRFMSGGSSTDITPLRAFGNRFFVGLTNVLFSRRDTELCYGYMALRRDALPVLALDADGFEIETQIVLRALRGGLRVAEVPSHETPRLFGTSNLSVVRDGTRVLRQIFRERFAEPVTPVSSPAAEPVAVEVLQDGLIEQVA